MLQKTLILIASLLMFFTGCSSKSELAVVNENGQYGTIETNLDKKESDLGIKPIYDEISSFDDLNNKNIKIEHPNIVNLHWLHNYSGKEYTIVEYKGKYGVVSRENEMLVKPIYDSISKLFNGYFVIKLANKYGYMNKEFEVVQKPIFRNAREFLEDASFVQSNANGKWGCITKDMELKIIAEYDEVYNFSDGFARVVKNGKWGYINKTCEVVTKTEYDYAHDFSAGFAKVIKNKKVGYINEKGSEATQIVFSKGDNF